MRIALTGNPNSGKTTMFNALTGSSEKVGNWAGVTVEKKEHSIKKIYYNGEKELTIVDLPGAYSMSPFTNEESITYEFVQNEKLDAIINIVDVTNLSRSLFFTTQLLELGIPVVVALNKTDLNDKKHNKVNAKKLSEILKCPVIETVSTSSLGLHKLVDEAIKLFGTKQIAPFVNKNVNLFNKESVLQADKERFNYVNSIVKQVEKRKTFTNNINVQDKVDKILTNKWIGIGIFAVVMFLVFWISQVGPGAWIAEGVTIGEKEIPGLVTLLELFQEFIAGLLENANPILSSIIVDGIIGGVAAVVGFLPLVMVMYFLIALLEDCGYMARVSVILDPIFKKVGLSGKSVIPFVIGTGCAIPGVMACRTIKNERERKATAILAPFMPCGAKLPVISLFTGAFFSNSQWVAPIMYFVGIIIIFLAALLINLITGIRKKSYFIIELPEYKVPYLKNAFETMLQRGWSYIVKAGTIILVCNFAVQLMLTFTWKFSVIDYDKISNDGLEAITEKFNNLYANSFDDEGNPIYVENGVVYTVYDYPLLLEDWDNVSKELTSAAETSILASIAKPFAYFIAPITGNPHSWQLSAATITGFIAKENVVGTLAVCYGTPNKINDDFEIIGNGSDTLASTIGISSVIALAFLMLNLFSPPCFAAIGAMNAELKDKKWLYSGIALQFGTGYSIAFLAAFFGNLFTKASYSSMWMPVLGWILVLIFAAILGYLIIKRQNELKLKK
jgi:ferrous iron transport protein B